MSPDIRLTDLPDGVRYHLPRRAGGCAVAGGCLVAVFGGAFCAAAAAGMVGVTVIGRKGDSAFAIIAGLMFVVPFLVLGLFLVLTGLWTVIGHIELTLAGGRITSAFKIGPLPYVVRRREFADLRRLAVVSDAAQKNAVLAAAFEAGGPVELAVLCPFDLLWDVGQAVAARLPALGAQPIELEAEWTDFTGERPVQPVLSRIVVEPFDDGSRFTIPAAGWTNAGPILLLIFGAAFAAAALFLASVVPGESWWVPLLPCVPAIGLLLGAFVTARRKVIFETHPDQLTLTRIGLRRREQSWPRDDLAAIRVIRELRKQTTTDQQGHTSTHWAWVVELQIHPSTGGPVTLSGRYGLHGRAMEQEWEWLATALRQALDVPG